MNVFDHFNQDCYAVCPICQTNEDKPVILVPIPGTEDGNNIQAKQVHKQCYDMIKSIFMVILDEAKM